jgi:DNA-binding response OmpR family regulator
MLTKILFIEDDADLARGISTNLDKEYVLDIASTGAEGIKKFRRDTYHLVMLDLKLPDMPGLEVCQQLRQMEKGTPILILTGTDDTDVQIQLLDAGADDYVIKPFDSRQLKARINALLRRSGLADLITLKTHDLVINTQSREVKRGQAAIPLRRKEYDILEYLTRNKGRVVTRVMICDNVWDKGARPNSIDVHIKHLRDKVDRPFSTPLIETTHGIGYLVKDLPVQ